MLYNYYTIFYLVTCTGIWFLLSLYLQNKPHFTPRLGRADRTVCCALCNPQRLIQYTIDGIIFLLLNDVSHTVYLYIDVIRYATVIEADTTSASSDFDVTQYAKISAFIRDNRTSRDIIRSELSLKFTINPLFLLVYWSCTRRKYCRTN